MKFAIVIAISVVLVLTGVGSAAQDSRVSVAASTVRIRETHDVRSYIQLLWNRDIRTRPIGHAVISCFKLGTGGLLGSGLFQCVGTYVLPLGKIVVQGLVHSYERYTLAITGGTGVYADAGGQLFGRRVGPGVQRLVFTL